VAYLYLLGAANGLALAVLLFFTPRHSGATRVMACWCFLLALSFLGNFIHIEQRLNAFSFLIGWPYYLPAAYGALLFLYCKKLLTHSAVKPLDALHLLPLLLCYALNIDILFAPAEQKLEYILSLPPQTPSFFVSQFILYAQGIIYGLVSIALTIQYRREFHQQFSTRYKGLISWMAILISLSMIIWLLKLLPVFTADFYWLSQQGSVLIVVLIYAVGFVHWLKPHLFFTEQLQSIAPQKISSETSAADILSTQALNQHAIEQSKPDHKASTEGNLALDKETRAIFAKVLINTLSEQQLYLQENLSLRHLSKHTNISIHHLSETLNHHLNRNFYRFINEYRVEHFCCLLTASPHATITELAFQSGFANKSTFNAVFKEMIGQTPSQYRKNPSMIRPIHRSESI